MIPTAYGLKRIVAQHRCRFWCADALDDLPAAPVYLFQDQERFDADTIDPIARDISAGPLRLPHRDVLFEVSHRPHEVTAVVAFVTTTLDEEIAGFLFVKVGSQWSDVLCWAHFTKEGLAECAPNPSILCQKTRDEYARVLTGLVWRALALLSCAAEVREAQFPRTRRPKLARTGVSGWTYRIVDIDPQRIEAAIRQTTGTHASPRWHIRRGHWRTLAGGRKTFVRECEVGDPARGGVIKDYRVQMEATI